jgi:hypothetical protein
VIFVNKHKQLLFEQTIPSNSDCLGPGHGDENHGHQQVPHQEEDGVDHLAGPVHLHNRKKNVACARK